MSHSFHNIVQGVLIDKVYKYAGRCVNCGEFFSGDIVPELGEYYCYDECGPVYKNFDNELRYKPFHNYPFLASNFSLGNTFLSYLRKHYLYGRLQYECNYDGIHIFGINHYKYDLLYSYEGDVDEDRDNGFYRNICRLIVDIMKNRLQLPKPCCTAGYIIGADKQLCNCSYALSYRITNYFENKGIVPTEYVKYINDVNILAMMARFWRTSHEQKHKSVIFVPKNIGTYYKSFFTRKLDSRELDYDEKINTKYGSFIVVNSEGKSAVIPELFKRKEGGEIFSLSSTKMVNYLKSMRSPMIMRYANSTFEKSLLSLLHKAFYRGDKFLGVYITIIPKKLLDSSTVLIESMFDDVYPFEYIETNEAFFLSKHYPIVSRSR